MSINVLLVDPHNEERAHWTERLSMSSQEYVFFEAETGKTGLDVCQSQPVDCVVTELSLPDMSGFEFLIKLIPRAYRPELAVIVLTHLIFHPLERVALNNGAIAFLVKSRITSDDLDRAIRKAIAVVGPNKSRQS